MADAQQIEFLLAESAIRQLYGRYADALWRKDTHDFEACFTERAVWKIAGTRITGRGDIGRLFDRYMAGVHKVMMFTGIPVLEVAAGTASGRVHVTEYCKLPDQRAVRTLGVYYDRFVAAEGRWRFQSHHFNLYYYGPADFSEPYYECQEYGSPPGMPGPDDPTTVRRA